MRILQALMLGLFLAAVFAGSGAAQDTIPEPQAEEPAQPDDGGEPAAEADGGAENAGEADAIGPQLPAEPPPPIYEDQLLRLSEILGALSFLRGLCGEPDAVAWREEMSALLAAEQPGPQRRSRLIGRFNHGYETFNAVYRSCTPSARYAIRRYLGEGQTLSADVRSRYSQ
jgi:uncharacterized protein (TIGR02301 family)